MNKFTEILQNNVLVYDDHKFAKTEVGGTGKRPIESWTNPENQYTYSEISSFPSYALILNSQNYLVYDTDAKESVEHILDLIYNAKLNVLITETDKGYHVYFKNSRKLNQVGVGVNTLIGLPFDVFDGKSSRLLVQKTNEKVRRWLIPNYSVDKYTNSDTALEFLDPAPDFLLTQSGKIEDQFTVSNLGEGDTQIKLFKYTTKLAMMNEISWKEIILLTNMILERPRSSRAIKDIIKSVEKFAKESKKLNVSSPYEWNIKNMMAKYGLTYRNDQGEYRQNVKSFLYDLERYLITNPPLNENRGDDYIKKGIISYLKFDEINTNIHKWSHEVWIVEMLKRLSPKLLSEKADKIINSGIYRRIERSEEYRLDVLRVYQNSKKLTTQQLENILLDVMAWDLDVDTMVEDFKKIGKCYEYYLKYGRYKKEDEEWFEEIGLEESKFSKIISLYKKYGKI